MREPGLGCFFVMLAKITGRVKELLWNDRCFQPDVAQIVEKRFALRADCFWIRAAWHGRTLVARLSNSNLLR